MKTNEMFNNKNGRRSMPQIIFDEFPYMDIDVLYPYRSEGNYDERKCCNFPLVVSREKGKREWKEKK